ncbi:hypothetical protein KIN20_000424 [Parelaphostrongylus tenuis]|uniref:Uncharacterized protein n=1 Tax=Parelaphostrongylus tenuis TaxID=148309 RepID=A0AAD5QG12_PARTN|nr:hypothetical protein KIN20_000424 [Parelaphostrongylus tenuis]
MNDIIENVGNEMNDGDDVTLVSNNTTVVMVFTDKTCEFYGAATGRSKIFAMRQTFAYFWTESMESHVSRLFQGRRLSTMLVSVEEQLADEITQKILHEAFTETMATLRHRITSESDLRSSFRVLAIREGYFSPKLRNSALCSSPVHPLIAARNMRIFGQSRVTFYRFYHVFQKGELENLVNSIPSLNVIRSSFEHGNWCVVVEKVANGAR